MAIRKVARLGHPVLRRVARNLTPAEIGSPEFERLVADLVDTMHEYGGIGLAAPQIRESVRVAVLEVAADSARYPGQGDQPLSVFINPTMTVLDAEVQGFWEGCLSVPELRGLVFRPRRIRVDYLGLDGGARSIEAEDFLATVFQHELDHLDGVLFVDRLKSEPGRTPLAFTEEYQRYLVPREDEAIGELPD